jgi:hypothetical protein
MLNKPVKVAANKAGHIINVSKNNPEYGYVRLIQDKIEVKGSFVDDKQRSTLLTGKMEVLESMNLTEGTALEGNIVICESLTPFSRTDPNKDLKYAGKTGVVCTLDGEPIYRKSFYTQSDKAQDEFISHDNTQEIINAKEEAKEADKRAIMTANQDFDTEIIEEDPLN